MNLLKYEQMWIASLSENLKKIEDEISRSKGLLVCFVRCWIDCGNGRGGESEEQDHLTNNERNSLSPSRIVSRAFQSVIPLFVGVWCSEEILFCPSMLTLSYGAQHSPSSLDDERCSVLPSSPTLLPLSRAMKERYGEGARIDFRWHGSIFQAIVVLCSG